MKRADELTEAVLASRPRDRRALLRSAGIAQERMILAQEEHRDADAIAYAGKASHRLDEFLRLGDATDSERIQISSEYGTWLWRTSTCTCTRKRFPTRNEPQK